MVVREHAESTRRWLAYSIMMLLGVVVAAIGISSLYYSYQCWLAPGQCQAASSALNTLVDGLQPMFTALTGLVGSVVGFYFGSRQREEHPTSAPAIAPNAEPLPAPGPAVEPPVAPPGPPSAA